jgi:DNA-binding transcriptional ArsR family regulator
MVFRPREAQGVIGLCHAVQRWSLHDLDRMYPFGYVLVMDAVAHALSDASRRTMLEVLRQGPATVGELAERLPIARPGVSRHLRVLRAAGLADVHPEAQWRVYSLRPEPLAEVDAWLANYRHLWDQRMDALHAEIARGQPTRRSTT